MQTLQAGYYGAPVDPAAVTAHWRSEGYSSHTMTDRAGQQWNDFVHSTNELLTVIEGRLRLIRDGESVEAGPGDLVYIPKRVPHSVHNIAGTDTTWMFGYD